jgi:steroid 5-alpha reductase family enzyme
MPLPFFLVVVGLAAASVLMVAVWAIARRIRNNGIVDVAWAGSFLLLAAIYAALGHGDPTRTWLVLAMVAAWSLRLTVYLYRRVMSHHPVEDTRYQDLRRDWARNLDVRFFVFFQAQAAAAVLFSVPHALAMTNPAPGPTAFEWVGVAIFVVGLAGESLADWQLARFKADPANAGRICEAGLWNHSRHPNYFFEWLVWCGFAVVALPAPWGWLGLISPLLMLYTLLRVTGIPATEAARPIASISAPRAHSSPGSSARSGPRSPADRQPPCPRRSPHPRR